MNKKIINGALLGLLVVAAPACSFVSCKDYDDDFAAIRKEIAADKADLVTVKNDLNGQITTLKGQLDAANKKAAEIEAKLADYAKKSDLDPYAKKADLDATNATVQAQATSLQNALANIATLETKVKGLEEAKAQLQTLIDGKVDKTEFNNTVADILSKIKAVQGNVDALEKACNEKAENLVKADKALSDRIDAQKAVIDAFEGRLKAVETKNFLSADQIAALQKVAVLEQGVADNKKAAADNKAKLVDLETELGKVKSELADVKTKLADRPTKAEVEQMIKDQVDPIKDQIVKINERLNFLEYNLLVGLELIPDSYYRGIEAIESNQFSYNKWNVNKVVNGVVEYKQAPSQVGGAPVLTSRYAEAVYHLNPAGAKIDTAAANFTYLPIDRAYRGTNSAAVIKVKKATVENGLLKLVLDIQGATKDIDVDKFVTTAALQYKAPGATPRIITSAYDAIYTNQFSKLEIFDLDKSLVASVDKGHETSGWDINNEGDSLAIATKIRTNGVQKDGTTIAMDQNAAEAVSRLTKNGFHYEYRLVKTANDKSYEAFTLDSKTGLIKAKYDANKPFVNVGKTATVRVTLVHGTEDVATLGFFTVHISQKDAIITDFTNKNELKFTCSNNENAADAYSAKVEDLAKVIKDKASLEANEWEFVKNNAGDLTQFTFNNQVATAAPANKVLGQVKLSTDGKNLVWDNIKKSQVASLKAGESVATYVKVQKKGDPSVRFFVKLNYNPATEQAAPVATFAGKRISNDWFKNNIRTDEQELRMHFYIEPNNTQFNRFEKFMYSINESYLNGTVKIAPLTGYSQAVLNSVHSGWRFVMPKEDVVPGTDGKMYKLTVNNTGSELYANGKKIAQITNDQVGTIELLNNPTTQVLLNNAGHKELNKLQTLTARVGYVTTVCAQGEEKVVKTNGDTEFDVKFLRPLDLNFEGAVEFTDANIGTTTQSLAFANIANFIDWRDRNAAAILANDHVTLENLYGVSAIYVANESEWTTDLNGSNISNTKLVQTFGDRGLHMNGGTAVVLPPSALVPGYAAYDVNHLPSFTYTTQQKAFKDYHVRVPVKVAYSWGAFDAHITVTIKGTLNNDTNNTRRK